VGTLAVVEVEVAVEVLLKLVDGRVEGLPEGHGEELLLGGPVEVLAEAVGLGRADLGSPVLDAADGEEELKGVVQRPSAVLASVVQYQPMFSQREATSTSPIGSSSSRVGRHEGGLPMSDKRCRGPDDVIVGLDLASQEHQVVVLDSDGRRLMRFRISHSLNGLEQLLDRTLPARLERVTGERVFCFEATGHLWETVAGFLEARQERYPIVNPLATFRVREARQLNRHKTDLTDAEQIADLVRTGVHTRTQLETDPYMTLRRT
jgi:hypothetical protein